MSRACMRMGVQERECVFQRVWLCMSVWVDEHLRVYMCVCVNRQMLYLLFIVARARNNCRKKRIKLPGALLFKDFCSLFFLFVCVFFVFWLYSTNIVVRYLDFWGGREREDRGAEADIIWGGRGGGGRFENSTETEREMDRRSPSWRRDWSSSWQEKSISKKASCLHVCVSVCVSVSVC